MRPKIDNLAHFLRSSPLWHLFLILFNQKRIIYFLTLCPWNNFARGSEIEKNLDQSIFEEWLNNKIEIDHSIERFLTDLIEDNKSLIETYGEEDLKVKFIVPILNKIRFQSDEKKIRYFYELSMTYETGRLRLLAFSLFWLWNRQLPPTTLG